jgi:hypothetical protein
MEPVSGAETLQMSQRKKLLREGASELRRLVDHDHPELSVRRRSERLAPLDPRRITNWCRCVNPRDGSRQGSMPAGWRPLGGSRRKLRYVSKGGIPISRDRMQNQVQRMG